MRPIVDMHCDLLCYLANNPVRSALDLEVRCSLPQLRRGNVSVQTMAIFTETGKGSTRKGEDQISQFVNLPKLYPNDFQIIQKNFSPHSSHLTSPIKIIMALENASGVFEEDEPLENGFKRILSMENKIGKIMYISLTWNLENRFGGGAYTSIGLKADGCQLLDFLHEKQIAVDLSHTSDPLAHDILNYIDKRKLNIPIVASHSNFRAISHVPRNLPDEIALEILRRKGIIGFVFYRDFIGCDESHMIKQFEHLMKLGGEKEGCFGADFFFGGDLPPAFSKPFDQLFFSGYEDASTAYQGIMHLWEKHLGVSQQILDGVAHQNFVDFYKENINVKGER